MKTTKVLDTFPDIALARDLHYMAFEMAESLETMVWFSRQSAEEFTKFPDSPDEWDDSEVEQSIHMAHQDYEQAIKCLKDADERMAKFLKMRGEFAALTGIPMFSHISRHV